MLALRNRKATNRPLRMGRQRTLPISGHNGPIRAIAVGLYFPEAGFWIVSELPTIRTLSRQIRLVEGGHAVEKLFSLRSSLVYDSLKSWRSW